MAVRGTSRTSRQQRKRVRRRALGAVLVVLGVLLWGGTAIMRITLAGFPPELMIYLGITVGGSAVMGGILLISVNL
jgi:small neutral amino acid transporter SnatA (MarC family)